MATGRGTKPTKTARSDEDVDVLLKRIDEQNEQITRIQSKFRDVTVAYKNILSEKKALEITIKTLMAKNNSLTGSSKPSGVMASASQSDVSETEQPGSGSEAGGKRRPQGETEASSEEKIAALSANIQVILENKAQLEMSYQAEKKKLRADIEELKAKLEAFKLEAQRTNESNELKIKELKANIKQSHADRESLTVELNNLVKAKQADQENRVLSMHEEHQTLVINLRNENNELKTRVKNLSKQFENKCEELVQCQNDYKKLKLSHEEQLKADETELAKLRNELREQTQASEKRAGDLESRIAELCSTIGDSSTGEGSDIGLDSPSRAVKLIGTLKNKSLEHEMAELNLKSSDKMDFDSAVEQISQLKSYIESTARDLNINFNFNEIWLQSGEFNSKLEKEKQKELEKENEKLRDENRHLKEEYEKFKIRTNYLLKSAKLNKEQNQESSSENQQLQAQVSKLKDELESLKKRLHALRQEKDDELRRESESHEREVSELRAEMRSQFEKLENERMKNVADLELELKKQRERTMRLLAEKDFDLDQLNQQMRLKSIMGVKNTKPINDDSSIESNSSSLTEPNLEAMASGGGHLLEAAEAASAELSPSYMLYYNQQLAYKDAELNKLRLTKSDLEYKMKQLADEHSVDIDRMQKQIELLKEEIERCKLNDARDELNRENLEYIKNVIFSYMTTRDPNVRTSMVNAIIQILKFSKSEKLKLNQILNGGNGGGAAAGGAGSSGRFV